MRQMHLHKQNPDARFFLSNSNMTGSENRNEIANCYPILSIHYFDFDSELKIPNKAMWEDGKQC